MIYALVFRASLWWMSALTVSFPSCLASFVYETEHFNGVAELLEILGRWVDVGLSPLMDDGTHEHTPTQACNWRSL